MFYDILVTKLFYVISYILRLQSLNVKIYLLLDFY